MKLVLEKWRNPNGKLTLYDAGELLKALGQGFVEIENSIIREVEYTVEDCNEFLTNAQKLIGKMDSFQEKLLDNSAKIEKMSREIYDKTSQAVARVNYQLKALDFVKVDIPWNIREVLEIAEKMSHLRPEAFDRLVDLCVALRQRP